MIFACLHWLGSSPSSHDVWNSRRTLSLTTGHVCFHTIAGSPSSPAAFHGFAAASCHSISSIACESLTAEELAKRFISRVCCLHGAPDNIVSDRGSQLVSAFWAQFSNRLGVALKRSSSFHPQTDGQTERINSIMEAYLRAFCNFHQDDWVDWLPLAEFTSNSTVSESTGVSPFFANYGFHPKLGVEARKPTPPNTSATVKKELFSADGREVGV